MPRVLHSVLDYIEQFEMGKQGKRLSSAARRIVNSISEFMTIE